MGTGGVPGATEVAAGVETGVVVVVAAGVGTGVEAGTVALPGVVVLVLLV